MLPIQFDLNKSADALRLSLNKSGIVTLPKADCAFNLDVSGSFEDEHVSGLTQALLTRLTPWGIVFDPDQQLDVFTFSDGPRNVNRVGTLNAGNYGNFIARNIIDKVPGWCGGTDYSYVIEENLKHFGWTSSDKPAKTGLFGKLFGQTPQPAALHQKKRSIVLYVTDGDCNQGDKPRTTELLRQSQSRGDQVYFLFIGVSNQGGTFPFLKGLGDQFNNTGLVVINNLAQFVAQSDEQLNSTLLGSELVQWLKA